MTSSSASASPSDRARACVGVVGAGFLGGPLASRLAATRRVIATTRSGAREGDAPAGVEMRAVDVVQGSDEALRAALVGVEALVVAYAAGRQQDRRAVYVDGTRRLLEAWTPAGASLGARRVVYVSSTSALPDVDGWVDETAAAWPTSERGRVQREGEEVIREVCEARGLPWIILRLGGLYGPGRGLGRIYRSDPERALAGDGMQATNLIHRDDAIAAAHAALDAPAELSALIHVVDDDHRPRREMYARLAAAMGRPAPRWELPAAAQAGGKRVRNDRLRELLGVALRYPQHVVDPD
ncbi:MAG: NAD(P)H-binding protein [Nannocystaceae bacterium]